MLTLSVIMTAMSGDKTTIAPLFPGQVITAELEPAEADDGALLPEEQAAIADAIDKRRQQFAAGRIAARRALASLGVSHFPLVNIDRVPQWPEGIVGTISHTLGYAGVAVARRGTIQGLGLDVEGASDLKENIWKTVLTDVEREGVMNLPEADRGLTAKVIFSAKECLYKCQCSAGGGWLNFKDAIIEIDREAGSLNAIVKGNPKGLDRPGLDLRGRYLIADDLVFTAMVLCRSE